MTNRKERYYYLDMIKFIATLLIVFHHYQQLMEVEFENGVNFHYGKFYFGNLVELFFVISGFLIYPYIERIRDGLSFKSFYTRRFLRVFPLMAISVVVYSTVLQMNTIMPIERIISPRVSLYGIIISCLGLQSWFPQMNPGLNNALWYVSSLLLCYIIFCFIVYIAKKHNLEVNYLFLLISILGVCVHFYGIDLPFLNNMVARGYYAFFAGLVLADWLDKHDISNGIKFVSVLTIIGFIVLIILRSSFVDEGISYLLTFMFYPSMIVLARAKPLNRITNCKIWSILGAILFDVYVWHLIIISLVYKLNIIYGLNINFASYKIMIAEAIFIYAYGALSYYCLEKPISNIIGNKLASN